MLLQGKLIVTRHKLIVRKRRSTTGDYRNIGNREYPIDIQNNYVQGVLFDIYILPWSIFKWLK